MEKFDEIKSAYEAKQIANTVISWLLNRVSELETDLDAALVKEQVMIDLETDLKKANEQIAGLEESISIAIDTAKSNWDAYQMEIMKSEFLQSVLLEMEPDVKKYLPFLYTRALTKLGKGNPAPVYECDKCGHEVSGEGFSYLFTDNDHKPCPECKRGLLI